MVVDDVLDHDELRRGQHSEFGEALGGGSPRGRTAGLGTERITEEDRDAKAGEGGEEARGSRAVAGFHRKLHSQQLTDSWIPPEIPGAGSPYTESRLSGPDPSCIPIASPISPNEAESWVFIPQKCEPYKL